MKSRLAGFFSVALLSLGLHAAPLEVYYLANEGYLLRGAERAVIIDGLVTEPAWNYAILPDELYARMLAGEPPFERVNVLLASHVHADHFQMQAAMEFLEAHPEAVFHSSRQVTDPMRLAAENKPSVLRRIGATELPAGMALGFDLQGVRVEFFMLSHGTGRFADIQNFGQLITVGDKKVLHIGDAAMVPANFAGRHLDQRGIDIAFIPYWYFGYAEGIEIYRNMIGAKLYVASHVPPDKMAEVKADLAVNFPEVRILQQPMEKIVID